MINLNNCDMQASHDDHTTAEGPQAPLIQDNPQTNVSQELKF